MADSGNLKRLSANDIAYNVWQKNVMLNIANPAWRAVMASGAKTTNIPIFTSNASADNPADRDALRTGITLSKANVTNKATTRTLVRGGGEIDKITIRESGGGPQMEAQLNAEVAQEVSENVDSVLMTAVSGNSWTNDTNSFSFGSATDFVSRGSGEPSTDDASKLVGKALKRVHRAMVRDNVIGGETTGKFPPSNSTAILPVELSAIVVDDLADQGVLQRPGDIAANAVTERGIIGTNAYQGRAYGIDLVYSNGIEVPATGNWDFYVIPNGGTFAGTYEQWDIEDFDILEGGGYLKRRYVWGATYHVIPRAKRLYRGVIQGGA